MENKKSRGWLVASRLIFYIGVFACMVGAIVYLVLHELGYDIAQLGPFRWENLYYVAALAGIFTVIAIILRIVANCLRHKSVPEAAEAVAEAEPVVEEPEVCNEPAVGEDSLPENEETVEETVEVVEAEPVEEPSDNALVCLYKSLKDKVACPETKEKILETVKKNAPVIVAVAATATVSVVVYKIISAKKKARIRKNILDLLY